MRNIRSILLGAQFDLTHSNVQILTWTQAVDREKESELHTEKVHQKKKEAGGYLVCWFQTTANTACRDERQSKNVPTQSWCSIRN